MVREHVKRWHILTTDAGSTQQEWLTTEHAVHDNGMFHLYELASLVE